MEGNGRSMWNTLVFRVREIGYQGFEA